MSLSMRSTPSQSSAPSALGFDRPSEVVQPLCVSRLNQSAQSYSSSGDQAKYQATATVLAAIKNIEPADDYFASHWPGKPVPPELRGETIGELVAKYPDPPRMDGQRRYSIGPSIFSLPRDARAAATYGLYVDGDLEASELESFRHECIEMLLDYDELKDVLDNREDKLLEAHATHPWPHHTASPETRRNHVSR